MEDTEALVHTAVVDSRRAVIFQTGVWTSSLKLLAMERYTIKLSNKNRLSNVGAFP